MNRIVLSVAVVAIGAAGCSRSDLPDLGTVNGTVTLDGNPLANALVNFTPADGGRPSSGETDADGRYTLLYLTDAPGAIVGQHAVTVELIVDEDTDNLSDDPADWEEGQQPPPTLPASAIDGSIVKEVEAGENEINIQLVGSGG